MLGPAAAALSVLLLFADSAGTGGTSTARPSRGGWPDTNAGEMGRRWVAAFCAGEKEMSEFYRTELAAENRAKRSLEERLASYRKLRERFGQLTLGAVLDSKPDELKVSLVDSDAERTEFTFTVEKKAPYKLLSVSLLEKRSLHGGFHH